MASGYNTIKNINGLFRSRFASVHEIADIYRPTIRRNKEKIIDIIKEKIELGRRSEIAKKMKIAKGFYTLEMAPPASDEMKKLLTDVVLVREFFQSGCFKYLTVKQAWLLFLVGAEVSLWFFLGETIGKFHLVGYKV